MTEMDSARGAADRSSSGMPENRSSARSLLSTCSRK